MPSTPASSVLKPHGILIVSNPEGSMFEADTLQCCHCSVVWVVQRGSGRKRGFCTKCKRPTCGRPECEKCECIEKRLDDYEAGKRLIL